MSIDLPLDRMSLADKLETMELLWADLSKSAASFPSPTWHKCVLDERSQLVAEGKLRFVDWDDAISQLKDEVRGNPTT